MNITETDRIFELLPAFLRLRDAEEGQRIKGRVAPGDPRPPEDFGPLRTLASLIAREAQIVDEGLNQQYANAFIETCAPWVIPYLGDLLGVRGLADIPEGIDMRARVANALDLRSRKGTLRALEHASADASGWPVFAVEYWKRLVHTQAMRLPHLNMGKTVDLRDKPALARIGTPFARTARNADVRRIDSMGGRWNLGNIGLHVWRLRPYSITTHRVFPVAAGRRDFRFHPLGCDAQLYARTGIRGGVETPAREIDMPVPIDRAIMAEDPSRFYGPGMAMQLRVGNNDIPVEEICAAHLGDLPGGGAEPNWNRSGGIAGLNLIDPELGRVIVDPNRTGTVRISCHFARPLEIGGGEHSRASSVGSVENPLPVPIGTNIVTTVNNDGGEGTFLLAQTNRYTANGQIDIPADATLRLIASDGVFPTIRLGAAGLRFALGDGASLELNGLRIFNGEVRVTGTGAGTTLSDCTLVPGHALDRSGQPANPGAASLTLTTEGASLRLNRCITGPVIVATDVDVRFVECIVDAGAADTLAYSQSAGAQRTVVAFDRCTIRGRVRTSAFADGARVSPEGFGVAIGVEGRLATSDTLFVGTTDPAVQAEHRQVGCLRFSYVPPNSETPRLYRCISAPDPRFTSVNLAQADYMLLSRTNPDAITRGAENGGEMGVYNRAAHQVRADNIRRSIEDFLRFGHAAGVFHEN